MEAMQQLDGVHDVQTDYQSGIVTVEYDVFKADLEHIEHQIEQAGYSIHDSFMHRIKDTFVHFNEENERDNLDASPMSCCPYPDSTLELRKQ